MKKVMTFLLVLIGIMVLAACGPDVNDDVDCTVTPEHEDCTIAVDCELNPDDPICNIVYTFEDSYELLDIENENYDSFEDMSVMISDILLNNSELFAFTDDYEFDQFYSNQVNSSEGLTQEELLAEIRDLLAKA